jgi:hypothetical protein
MRQSERLSDDNAPMTVEPQAAQRYIREGPPGNGLGLSAKYPTIMLAQSTI